MAGVRILPVLFNTDMVRAILDNRKTVTRRVVKPTHGGVLEVHDDCGGVPRLCEKIGTLCRGLKPPCQPGNILYVRETWSRKQATQCLGLTEACPHKSCETANGPCFGYDYIYKTTDSLPGGEKWHPAIHMPKEAARIFLRVTGVRVERLQDITDENCEKEGIKAWSKDGKLYKYAPADDEGDYPIWPWSDTPRTPQEAMERIWDSTIKPSDRATYGWDVDPWVWVIEFERCEKPDDSCH